MSQGKPISGANPTIKWMVGLAIASFIGMMGLKLTFDNLYDELNARGSNEQTRLFIGQEIVRGINGIEKDLYLLAATTNPAAVRRVSHSIDSQLDKLRHDLGVLKDGGVVYRQVALNIEGHEEMVHEAKYVPDETASQLVMEVIEIQPQLDEIDGKMNGLVSLLMKSWDYQENRNRDGFFVIHDEIDLYLKHLPPYFARINENANRLLYESSERMRFIDVQLIDQRARLKKLEYVMMSALILLAGLGAVVFIRRIETANRQLQEAIDQMRAAKEHAERASRTKSEFVSRMSHELRTPLNAIIGFADLLKAESLSPSHQNYVNLINDSGKHLMELINAVLDHAKIEAGSLTLEKIPFDFHAAIEAVKSIIDDRASAKGLVFSASISPQLPRYVVGDPTRLRQILINLLVNGVKFTEQGSVELRIAPDGERIHFSVRDTGIGMSAEALANLFKPFSQADVSVTRKYGGTGLGLVISKELIEAMGGHIEVESAPGTGTVFWFSLPLQVADALEAPGAQDAGRTDSVAELVPGKVLIVDDNRVNLQLASAMLDRLGLAHELADNGATALSRLAEADFALVLMDMEMPEMDGITATQQLRAREAAQGAAHLPVIAMTANALQEDRERCFAAGMDGYIAKPVSLAALQAELRRLFLDQQPVAATAAPASPIPVAAVGPVYDRAAALAMLGDESLLDHVAGMFVADVPTYLAEIDAAFAAGDAERLTRAAHTIKGLFATFVAAAGQAVAAELEQTARRGDLAACSVLITPVRGHAEALAAALARK